MLNIEHQNVSVMNSKIHLSVIINVDVMSDHLKIVFFFLIKLDFNDNINKRVRIQFVFNSIKFVLMSNK